MPNLRTISKAIGAFLGAAAVALPVWIANLDTAWAALAPVVALAATYFAPKNAPKATATATPPSSAPGSYPAPTPPTPPDYTPPRPGGPTP